MRVESYDEQFGIELISHPTRSYWIRRHGGFKGFDLLAYHLAEHDWMRSRDPVQDLRESSIVIDCGAHVGVFTDKALTLGAEKVIAIDPDPIQVECLRRNFSREIAEGRVVVVPKAVWSSEGSMALYVGGTHSGSSSLTGDTGGEQLEVAVTTIDALVAELNLARVDFIKLDIEGAEREALKGAALTLKKHRPRIMIDTYHRADDLVVLPQLIAQAQPDYEGQCGWCELRGEDRIVPHNVVYE